MMDLLDINQNDYNIHTIENTFIKKTGENTIKQLISLIENNFKDLSKTLFMKGKIAEILAGYLAIDNTKTPFCAIIDSVKKSKQIIKKNIDKQLTSKCIAEEIHINETELKQNFKNITGLSIQKFGIKLKMEKAKKLLKLTEMPIYQIAEETGYKNATHFTNAFKKNTNILPKKFRTDFNLK
jgi:AraC-like DNA-binding protein